MQCTIHPPVCQANVNSLTLLGKRTTNQQDTQRPILDVLSSRVTDTSFGREPGLRTTMIYPLYITQQVVPGIHY